MGYVYILSNIKRTVLYIGVTSNLSRRLYEHRNELFDGFSKRYHTHSLVYVETYANILDAIAREKQLKGLAAGEKGSINFFLQSGLGGFVFSLEIIDLISGGARKQGNGVPCVLSVTVYH